MLVILYVYKAVSHEDALPSVGGTLHSKDAGTPVLQWAISPSTLFGGMLENAHEDNSVKRGTPKSTMKNKEYF